MKDYPVIVIGGGPAGLFCSAIAAEAGHRVILLEKMPSCGRKLLVTGSGQCNLTHEGEVAGFFPRYGDNGRFLRPSLLGFSNDDLVRWCSGRGLPLVPDETGKVFPVSRRAADVLALLLGACHGAGVEIRTGEPVRGIRIGPEGFSVRTPTREYTAGRVVIATGGASYPATGSTGDGFALARLLGHLLTPVAPALAPLYVRDYPFQDLSGISFEGVGFTLYRDGKKIRYAMGDLLFTHSGFSGPGILHLSRYVQPGDTLAISWFPAMPRELLDRDLAGRMSTSGTKQVKSILPSLGLPSRFAARLIDMAGIPPDRTGAHLSKQEREHLARILTGLPFEIISSGGWDEAMVTRGGVSLGGVNPQTMESRIHPGLYFIGEVLDIDGDTGGYNLQAAFSTAMAAARAFASL